MRQRIEINLTHDLIDETPGGLQLQFLWIIPTATVSPRRESWWLTAAIPVDNPYCSCKLTHDLIDETPVANSCNPCG